MRRLTELLAALSEPVACPAAIADAVMIKGLTADSRAVREGFLFAALKGSKSSGEDYTQAAVQAGASALLCDLDAPEQQALMLRTKNPRLALSQMAAAFYQRQPQHVVAITGTDGKTSTADFFRQFWHGMGEKSASLGTLGALSGKGDVLREGTHTTPDPVSLHALLADMAGSGITHLAMEASSHGLHQYRLDGVRLEAAAFTNIARDHLDYHKDEDNYFAAKARLFAELLPEGATAVLNADDARFAALKELCTARHVNVMDFGLNAKDLRIEKLTPHGSGQQAGLMLLGKPVMLDIPLVGAFQAMNILAALGLSFAVGGRLEEALAVVPRLKGVPGRLEHVVTLANGASVYVDYAHTPMALANILKTLRPHTSHKLHVVFGCGGDRDPGKRPQMGRAAVEYADSVIITDDNPRSEDPSAIRRAIFNATPDAKEVADRKEAIYVALRALGPGDILVIAGKGHEKTQIIGDKVLPFDDVSIANHIARELKLVA